MTSSRAPSGRTPKTDSIQKAIAAFPDVFGLKGFPGKRFKINASASYASPLGSSNILLYLYTAEEGEESLAFCKGTVFELEGQVVPLEVKQYGIGIDCAPGRPRPDSYLPGVLEGTGLDLGEPVSKLFGAWNWDVPTEQNEAFVKAQPVIVERLKALYNANRIRAAEWSKP